MSALIPAGRPTRSERPLVIGVLAVLTALCWAYLVFRASRITPNGTETMSAFGSMEPPPPPAPYQPDELARVFGLWAVIAAAMMLPPAAPTVLVFARVSRLYHAVRHPNLATILFVAGYLLAWCGFGALATLAQWALHDAGALDAGMAVSNSVAVGLALVAAGVYQWTPAKYACLHQCRAPLSFVLTGWRRGAWGAFRMGLTHGNHCIGCCWLLMLLLFAAGVMNLAAAAALTALVLAEKLVPGGAWLAALAGLALLTWGTLLLFP